MIADQDDIIGRLKAVLPRGWFAAETPVLDALLSAIAVPWTGLYRMVEYVGLQTRTGTASDGWLDLIAVDFFGRRLQRRPLESDDHFRAVIKKELLRERATRRAVVQVLEDLTGRTPLIFEPAHCGDTGSYGVSGQVEARGRDSLAYGMIGGWGSLSLPFQVFVTAFRPVRESGISGVGWGDGGYGLGHSAYVDVTTINGTISDTDINLAIASVMPVGTVAWTRILS